MSAETNDSLLNSLITVDLIYIIVYMRLLLCYINSNPRLSLLQCSNLRLLLYCEFLVMHVQMNKSQQIVKALIDIRDIFLYK